MIKKITKTIKTIIILAMAGLLIGQLFGGGGLFYYLCGLVFVWCLLDFKKAVGSNQYINRWRL